MSAFQRWLVWSTSGLTGATGLVYWWMKNRMEPLDAWAAINHPLQPWMLKAHILVAPLMVFAVGVIAGEHIWRQYRQKVKAGRWSGLTAMWVLAPLIVSGYVIQVVTDVGWLEALAWAHLGTGVVYLAGLAAHHRVFRRVSARREASVDRDRRRDVLPDPPPGPAARAPMSAQWRSHSRSPALR